MVFWAVFIAFLAVAEVTMLCLSFPLDAIHLVAILILLCVLAVLYRIHSKILQGKIEKLEKEVEELKAKIAR